MPDGPRISVVGTSGAGKTTMAKRAARKLGVPFLELDSLRHGPNWKETPDLEFRALVEKTTSQDRWVIDGNYGVVRDLVWPRATQILWIDPPLPFIMGQVIWRSLSRAITRQVLWNGNREEFRKLLSAEHPIRWALSTHAGRQAEFLSLSKTNEKWIRLRNRAAMDAWLAALDSASAGSA